MSGAVDLILLLWSIVKYISTLELIIKYISRQRLCVIATVLIHFSKIDRKSPQTFFNLNHFMSCVFWDSNLFIIYFLLSNSETLPTKVQSCPSSDMREMNEKTKTFCILTCDTAIAPNISQRWRIVIIIWIQEWSRRNMILWWTVWR